MFTQQIAPIYPVYAYDENGNRIYDEEGNTVYDFGDGTYSTRMGCLDVYKRQAQTSYICFYISLVIYQTAYGIEITILWALYTTVTVVQLAISIGI